MKSISLGLLAQILSVLSSLFVLFMLPIRLEVAEFGEYQWYILLCGYIGLFHFGVGDGILIRIRGNYRYIRSAAAKRQFGIIVASESLLSAFILFALFVLSDKLNYSIANYIAALSIGFVNVAAILGFYLQGSGHIKEYYLTMVSQKLLIILIFVVLWNMSSSVGSYIIAYFLSLVIQSVVLILLSKEIANGLICMPRWKDLRLTFLLFKKGAGVLMGNLVTQWILGFGYILIKIMSDAKTFGAITYAGMLGTVIIGLFVQVGLICYPRLCNLSLVNCSETVKSMIMVNNLIGALYILSYIIIFQVLNFFEGGYIQGIEYAIVLGPMVLCEIQMQSVILPYVKSIGCTKLYFMKSIYSVVVFGLLCPIAFYEESIIGIVIIISFVYSMRYILIVKSADLKIKGKLIYIPLASGLALNMFTTGFGHEVGFLVYAILVSVFIVVFINQFKFAFSRVKALFT